MLIKITENGKGKLPIVVPETAKSHTNGASLPEILVITTYPPRECGIATYSQDLIKALNNTFSHSFNIGVCPVESCSENHQYARDTTFVLNTDYPEDYKKLAGIINVSPTIRMVMIQHEFGLFRNSSHSFILFVAAITKPVIIVFHTVLPLPDKELKNRVQRMAQYANSIIVMTNSSKKILVRDYGVVPEKIAVIPHGTHLVSHADKEILKSKHELTGRKILNTFGLLSSGKSIETTLHALPAIIQKEPDVLFLIIGKTHPSVLKNEGEKYRNMLHEKVIELGLENHVRFINYFLPLPDLLEYLQLTDIYLFTSKDPNQAVSGTFSYAISCGCAVVSTPIPHALEVLGKDAGIIVDFENPHMLSNAVLSLLENETLKTNMSSNGLHTMASTAWENTAIAHARLFRKMDKAHIKLHYSIPEINLEHLKRMTTDFGIIQFAVINKPDIDSGYTLDDNARALIAMCRHLQLTGDMEDIRYIEIYLNYIAFCQQPQGYFFNYTDKSKVFTYQNYAENLSDSNGRAVWALGYLLSMRELLPAYLGEKAENILRKALINVNNIHSTRSMAFIIKGLYYYNLKTKSTSSLQLIERLGNRLVQMYRHEADREWQWFESYLTYANGILPEAMLCAWLATGNPVYKEIAKTSFDFLLSRMFTENCIKVISNNSWLHKGSNPVPGQKGGEQPIDVAYTILALDTFRQVFSHDNYLHKMEIAFDWFLGNNHLQQIVYNPCTGGCYDGLEETSVNLNQGAESTISYLLARLTIEGLFSRKRFA